MGPHLASLALGLLLLPGVSSFAPMRRNPRAILAPLPAASRPGFHDGLGDGPVADLLTACAVEILGFLYEEVRDNTSKDWIENFFMEHFTERPASQAFLHRLMRAEPESVYVQQVRRKRQGSPGNPYIDQQKTVFAYTVLIEPRRVAERLMERRELLANEWREDLQRIKMENEEILRHYRERGSHRQRIFLADDLDTGSGTPHRRKYYRELKAVITDRGVDLALLELHSRYPAGEKWLRKAVDAGRAKGRRGDELVEAILRGPMVLLPTRSDGKVRAVEPERITNLVMASRVKVANLWREDLAAVTEVHRRLRAARLGEHFGGEIEA